MSDLVRNLKDRFSHEAHIEKFKPIASFHTPKTEFILMKLIFYFKFEPCSEKNSFPGIPPGMTQTGLCNHRKWLEA